jgi:hypothetical protein
VLLHSPGTDRASPQRLSRSVHVTLNEAFGFLSAIPSTLAIVIPATMKALVSPPVPTMLIVVVRPVIRRRVRERLDDRDAWKAYSDTDVGMSLGGHTVSHTCDPESGS